MKPTKVYGSVLRRRFHFYEEVFREKEVFKSGWSDRDWLPVLALPCSTCSPGSHAAQQVGHPACSAIQSLSRGTKRSRVSTLHTNPFIIADESRKGAPLG